MRLVNILIPILLLSACEKTIINRGYIIELENFKKVIVGKDNEINVIDKLGSPTTRSSVSNEKGEYTWYYVNKKMEKNGFLDPKVVEQKIFSITYSRNGIVKSIQESSDEIKIATVSEKTKTEGKTAGIIKETFGGLGKYMKRYTGKK
ncbi:MAG: outer membrane protein assembly factor BamE [Holosporales bacterium]|jgi:outer membrane protein assembly factor BamE (lipoprotein component of BamABCDE complex)|nr:outer membrane protein assembly factor BamE [Holosporales bacterium]